MNGFWAVTLFLLGLLLLLPGLFIWQLGILSVAMLAGAMANALWNEEHRQKPVVQIFSWMSGFVLLIETGALIFTRLLL